MDRDKFEAADALVNDIADIIDELLASEKAELPTQGSVKFSSNHWHVVNV